MSRQRIAKTINDAIHLECPHCEGRGKVKSVEAMALSFLRKVHGAAAKGTVAEVHGGLPLEVAYYLLNRKKRELTQIENDYEIEVTVKGKTSYLLNQVELETVKREKPRAEDVAKSDAESDEAPAPLPRYETVAEKSEATVGDQTSEGAVSAEGGKKRKRRRKKKKGAGDAVAVTEQAETTSFVVEQAAPETEKLPELVDTAEGAEGADESIAKHKKRKRRRGKKGPRVAGEVAAESGTSPGAAETQPAVVAVSEVPAAEPHVVPPAAEKPKRTRSARTRKKPVTDAVAESPAPEALVVVEEPPVTPKPRRRAAPKKTTAAVSPPPEVALEKAKPAPRARRKKKDDDSQ